MKSSSGYIRLPEHAETIAPVTILDGQGHVVRVVPETESRRPEPASRGHWRERHRRLPRPVAGPTRPQDAVRCMRPVGVGDHNA